MIHNRGISDHEAGVLGPLSGLPPHALFLNPYFFRS